jgi:ATP-dependent DNA helicase DinG
VFTSATLASAGGFDYFQSRLGLEDAETVLLPSPFDFSRQGTIYLPKMPPPNSNNFLDALASESIRLINLVKGKTLFLFTSFRNMHEIRRRLEGKMDYPILMQGEAPRHALLEQFKARVDSILLATSSFWQGVDVRGESLSCVIIDRLPFASPGDPVIAARIERIRRNGGNPFNDYQVPYAVLALKQGLGRLIRHRNDSGIIMVADSRMLSKGYGKVFLSSLPPAPRVYSFEDIEW